MSEDTVLFFLKLARAFLLTLLLYWLIQLM